MKWQYTFTRDAVPALQQEIEWALQRQNQRFADAIRRRHLPMRRRQQVAVAISFAGLLLLGYLLVTYPAWVRAQPFFYGLLAAFMFAGLIAGLALPRFHAWSRRTAGRMLARRAERMLAPLAARAPYTIDYDLEGGELRTRIDALDVHRVTLLADTRTVLSTDGVVLLFQRAYSLIPSVVVYVPGDAERDAVTAALVAAGAAHEHIAGAITGYDDPIPVARALR